MTPLPPTLSELEVWERDAQDVLQRAISNGGAFEKTTRYILSSRNIQLIAALKASEAVVGVLLEAVLFYANNKNWKSTHGNGGGVDDTIIGDMNGWSGGKKAFEALALAKKMRGGE
jgi:hypothetical protein